MYVNSNTCGLLARSPVLHSAEQALASARLLNNRNLRHSYIVQEASARRRSLYWTGLWIPTCTVVTLTQFSRSKVKFENPCYEYTIHPLVIALLLKAYIWLEGVQYLWAKFLALWSSFLQLAPQKGVFYPSLSKTFLRAKQLSPKTACWGPNNHIPISLAGRGWGFWGANHLKNMY